MIVTTGTRLGPYQIGDLIGRGGMGEVYRAHDTRLDRDVALKVLAPSLPATEDHYARFAREARTGALINHPNIVTVYDVGSHAGTPFVVSELLKGETLRERLKDGPLKTDAALHYARQIADGLVAAHQLSVVHRDLKPENIFITTQGDRVKILDFGLAKCRQQAIEQLQDPSRSTRPGTVMGTVGYMSPEQIRGKELDERSDLFSLGVMLYEMLSGKPPFHGDSAIDTLSAILKDEPRGLRCDYDVPPELERVIRHCLEKDREARFQSARDLLFNLDLAATTPASAARRRAETKTSMAGVLPWLRRLL
jgi:serine/threonine protein kinase